MEAFLKCLLLLLLTAPALFAEELGDPKELPARLTTQKIEGQILAGQYDKAISLAHDFLGSSAAEHASAKRLDVIKTLQDTALRLWVRDSFSKNSLASFTIAEIKEGAVSFAGDTNRKFYKVGEEYENATILLIEHKRVVLSAAHKRIKIDFEVTLP